MKLLGSPMVSGRTRRRGLGYGGFSVPREPVSWFVGSAETRDVFCSCRHISVNSPVGGLVGGGWLATDSVAVGCPGVRTDCPRTRAPSLPIGRASKGHLGDQRSYKARVATRTVTHTWPSGTSTKSQPTRGTGNRIAAPGDWATTHRSWRPSGGEWSEVRQHWFRNLANSGFIALLAGSCDLGSWGFAPVPSTTPVTTLTFSTFVLTPPRCSKWRKLKSRSTRLQPISVRSHRVPRMFCGTVRGVWLVSGFAVFVSP